MYCSCTCATPFLALDLRASPSSPHFEHVTSIMSFFAALLAATIVLPRAYGSYFFAEAASAGTHIDQSIPSNIWFQRFVYLLQTFALPFAYYFRPLCTALALFWYAPLVSCKYDGHLLIAHQACVSCYSSLVQTS
jgi:hypothetical protein